jgi:DNA-binding NtrC family response regulator
MAVADRFLSIAGGRWCDLVTGLRVELKVGSEASAMGVRDSERGILDRGTTDRGEAFVAWCDAWPTPVYSAGEPASAPGPLVEFLDSASDVPRVACLRGTAAHVRQALCATARDARRRGVVALRTGLLSSVPEVRSAVVGRTVLLLVHPDDQDTCEATLPLDLAWLALNARLVTGLVGTAPIHASHQQVTIDLPGTADTSPARPASLPSLAVPLQVSRATGPPDVDVRRVEAALARGDRLLAQGRPGAAERLYRAGHGLARRRAALLSCRAAAALRLARLLSRRRRAAAVLTWARDAVDAMVSTRDGREVTQAACLAGAALRRLGRADEAARVQATLVIGSGAGTPSTAVMIELARAYAELGDSRRVLIWLDRMAPCPSGAPEETALVVLRMRALLETNQFAAAGHLAARLSAAARQGGGDGHHHAALAWFHAWIGDAASLRRHTELALSCKAALDDTSRAGVAIAALLGARRLDVPGMTRAPARALTRLRHGADAGLRAQIDTALAGRLPIGVIPTEGGRVVLDDVLGVLRVCHEDDREAGALESLCRDLRRRLGCTSVAVLAGDALVRIAADGSHLPSAVAAGRAFATGTAVPFERVDCAVEAAVPIKRYGAPLGVIACRWPADAVIDVGRATALLAAAATSSLLALVELLDDAARPPADAPDDLGLSGGSRAMVHVRALVTRAAAAPFPVLIEGESGTGKELIARAIHRVGPRRSRRFCAINCAAFTDDLLEAELFGHARGAFTGAVAERVGLFEEADTGTLFLDEVAELSARGQAKLLRTLQEGEVRRVGENIPRRVDVRIVAATNRPLRDETAAGRYRADLRYRLDVIRIVVPPLRDRREDIPLLAARFWAELADRTGRRSRLDATALTALSRYDWPGNVRELQNVLAAASVQAPVRGRVCASDLPEAIREAPADQPGVSLAGARRAFERQFVLNALARAGGHRGAAARAMGLSRQGLVKLLTRLGIQREDPAEGEARRLLVGRFGRRRAAPVEADEIAR